MSTPPSYLVPEHLAVTPDVAARVHALLADGRARARADGIVLDARLATWLHDLDEMVMRGEPRQRVEEPPASRWLTTAEAAAELGIGERAVRLLAGRVQSKKARGRRWWSAADVAAEAEARHVA